MTDLDYKGEAMLLSWSDTPAGRKITFLLPDNGDQHPFRFFKAGNKYGQRFAIGCQAIDNDDNPEETKPGDPVKSVKGYARQETEAQKCGRLCNDPGFQQWLSDKFPDEWDKATFISGRPAAHKDRAAQVVKAHCRMDSRSALDSDPEGEHVKRWRSLLAQYEQDTGQRAEER